MQTHSEDMPEWKAGDTQPTPAITQKRVAVASQTSPRPFWKAVQFTSLGVILLSSLLGLFIVRGADHINARLRPGAGVTATSQPPETVTATPFSLPTISQTWGGSAEVRSFSTAIDATHVFDSGGITPDGRFLLGNQITLGTGENAGTARTGLYEIATHQFTSFGLADQQVGAQNQCCLTDGRYMIAVENSTPNDACAICHVRYWSYDVQSGQSRLVASGETYNGIAWALIDHGILSLQTASGDIEIANLVNGTIAPLSGVSADGAVLQALSWPYLLYAKTDADVVGYHMRNLTSGIDVELYQLDDNAIREGNVTYALLGDTLFIATVRGGTTLREIDHVMSNDAPVHIVANTMIGNDETLPLIVNARLVVFAGDHPFAWDRLADRFVALTSSMDKTSVLLSGDYLATVRDGETGLTSPQQVALYNTLTLPLANA